MSAVKKKKVGKRYSADEKSQIIAFIEKHNAEKGRGGQAAAVAQYGVSALTLSAWLKKASTIESPSGKKRGRKPGSKNKADSSKAIPVKGGTYSKRLATLGALADQIDTTEAQLNKLKAKFETLKKSL